MRYVVRLALIVCCAVVGLPAEHANAEKRVALVIGNSAYRHTRALPNPRNDAEAVAKLLRDNGFADVTLKSDLDYHAMRETVRLFEDTARGADVALVYYAGHGLEVAGENYLVPVDAKLLRDADLEYEAVTLASVLGAVDGAQKLKLVVLDACRNNPLGEKMALRAGAVRSVDRGLGRIEPKGEVLVAYSAKAGTVARDGAGRHSPYAEAMLRHMATPGLDVLRMLGRVKEAVLKATNGGQEPWIYGSPGGDSLALVPAKQGFDGKPTVVEPPAAERTWAAVKDAANIAVLEAFRQQFGKENPVYDRLAEARIEELKRQEPFVLLTQSSWNQQCVADSLPEVSTINGPKHGKITCGEGFSKVTHILGDDKRCLGANVRARFVYYVPSGSHAETDEVSLAVVNAHRQRWAWHCSIRIRDRSADCHISK